MAYKKWIIADADKEKASVLSEKLNIDPLVAFILVSRGIESDLSALSFLSDDSIYSSPFSLKDMDKAVDRINRALENNEKICIYGDYDCDGVTATALLCLFLEGMGANVIYYIPNRLNEGYGINNSAVDYIKSKGTDLIITVDNGISSTEAAEYIYSLGMELIVSDHHQPGEVLPRAEAVVNPHRKENQIRFRDYAGVGVAFKLACAVYGDEPDELAALFSDLVAIGTIGDVVSLSDENRQLVKSGLKLINSDSRIGISALRKAAGNADGDLTAGDIAFQLCPRINAAGRMDSASKAVELLLCEDVEEAEFLAQQLNSENVHRHQVEANIICDISEKIQSSPEIAEDRVIVVSGNDYHKGVIGIVAAHIVSKYGKPAVVISVDSETGESTGSARSVDGFNIYEAFSHTSDLLLRFGGHPMAAGMALRKENIDKFREKINEFADENYSVMPVENIKIDCKISPFYMDTDFVDSLNVLEPFGADNPQPLFCLGNMTLESVTPMGEGRHLKLEVSKKGKKFRVVKFRTSREELPYNIGDRIDLAVKLSKNLFKGKYYLSINAVDVRKHGIDDDLFLLQRTKYEKQLKAKYSCDDMYPRRSECSLIYKFIRDNKDKLFTKEDLYFQLNQEISYGKLSYAVDAFCECGLVEKDGFNIKFSEFSGKVNLENTKTLKTLKGRIDSGQ